MKRLKRLFITGQSGFVGLAFGRMRAHAVAAQGWSLVMIEVQSGAYLGQDDIVRFDDKYGRCK